VGQPRPGNLAIAKERKKSGWGRKRIRVGPSTLVRQQGRRVSSRKNRPASCSLKHTAKSVQQAEHVNAPGIAILAAGEGPKVYVRGTPVFPDCCPGGHIECGCILSKIRKSHTEEES